MWRWPPGWFGGPRKAQLDILLILSALVMKLRVLPRRRSAPGHLGSIARLGRICLGFPFPDSVLLLYVVLLALRIFRAEVPRAALYSCPTSAPYARLACYRYFKVLSIVTFRYSMLLATAAGAHSFRLLHAAFSVRASWLSVLFISGSTGVILSVRAVCGGGMSTPPILVRNRRIGWVTALPLGGTTGRLAGCITGRLVFTTATSVEARGPDGGLANVYGALPQRIRPVTG